MAQVEQLTKEQQDIFPSYIEKWAKIGMNCDAADMLGCVESARLAYKAANLKEPRYFFGPINNPIEAAYAETLVDEIVAKHPMPTSTTKVNGKKATAAQLRKLESEVSAKANTEMLSRVEAYFKAGKIDYSKLTLDFQIYGSMDASWLTFYDFFKEVVKVKECELLDGLFGMAKSCGWWTPLEDAAIFQHRPLEIHLDDRRRLHNINGPAVKFRGCEDANIYCVHNVRVEQKIIDRQFDWRDIDKQTNAEVKRVMIELYTPGRYITESGTKLVASDDWGSLYRKEIANDEPLVMVKVLNSTPEPDGSIKEYWLRVDPNAYGGVKTPLAAIASTFRNEDGSMVFEKPEDYKPLLET